MIEITESLSPAAFTRTVLPSDTTLGHSLPNESARFGSRFPIPYCIIKSLTRGQLLIWSASERLEAIRADLQQNEITGCKNQLAAMIICEDLRSVLSSHQIRLEEVEHFIALLNLSIHIRNDGRMVMETT